MTETFASEALQHADALQSWGVNFDFFEPVRILVLERFSQLLDKCRTSIHQKLNGTESQRTPDQVSCDRAIRYSGFLGVRSVGPVGDFLESSRMVFCIGYIGCFFLQHWYHGSPRRLYYYMFVIKGFLHHLESRWLATPVLVYHGPLQIATFWWLRHRLSQGCIFM